MERLRKPFQGVTNIIRFNWHFYVVSILMILSILGLNTFVSAPYPFYLNTLAVLATLSILVSLVISFYIYDLSNLYTLSWLNFLKIDSPQEIVTIHAGFDETSALLKKRFPSAHLHVFDFYDPDFHTEVSIKRARKAYPPYPNTKRIKTSAIPLKENVADYIFLILSAHEIRNEAERICFFNELNRVLKPSGKIIVVEHLRDYINFLAYNIGFLHFLPKSAWTTTFAKASFIIYRKLNVTPFITTFILEKDDSTA